MRKIPSLFKRNYKGDRLVRDEVVDGSEWVLAGEGIPTAKIDGTACTLIYGIFHKRYDRKLLKSSKKKPKNELTELDFKKPPHGWIAIEETFDRNTGHWPGWTSITSHPDDQWHREAIDRVKKPLLSDTFELVGPKVQSNPYNLTEHNFFNHGQIITGEIELIFEGIKEWLENNKEEGIVWYHEDGRMVKIKRKDFGLDWPLKEQQ